MDKPHRFSFINQTKINGTKNIGKKLSVIYGVTRETYETNYK